MNSQPTYTHGGGAFTDVYVSPDVLLLEKLDELIDLHFREQKDPGFYCSELAYTVRGLNEVTKLFRGRTVFRLIQERLLVEAKLLLSRSRMSAKLISYELGFEDPSYFGRFFRRMTGISPRQYRQSSAGRLAHIS